MTLTLNTLGGCPVPTDEQYFDVLMDRVEECATRYVAVAHARWADFKPRGWSRQWGAAYRHAVRHKCATWAEARRVLRELYELRLLGRQTQHRRKRRNDE